MQPYAIAKEDPRSRTACHLERLGRAVQFSPSAQKEFEELITRYPNKQAAVLPTLWLAQREFGWISMEAVDYVAGLCELAPSHVYGVVSFYTMYNRRPVGKYLLQLCTNLSCQLMGAEEILAALEQKLGVGLNDTTSDAMFTLLEVECLADCEHAPMIQVNDTFIGPLTPASAGQLIDDLRAKGLPPEGGR
ncbi:MAG: NAD(P)H-dependent oxidoreductase subunit E [Candidatus Eisenbacteria bacterium]|nr:NAD(P)H-dependent oxidoreductase subunit E [Candidatus Eisenbacteria bacterium]